MNGISVIICCYNSADRISKTLQYLANQKVNKTLQWEVVLVNNNSTDNTVVMAEYSWKKLGVPVPMAIVDEPKPGLSFAREAGMFNANFDLFIWCDDDNWLCDIYIQTAYDMMEFRPYIGALGGWCEAVFDQEKPTWFEKQARYFAVSRQGKQSGDITQKKGCLFGAGIVLRKIHWEELKKLGFKHLLSDRVGNKLSSGGDTEYCYALRLLGYKIWYDERLYFKHFLPKERLQLHYVSRIRQSMTHSNFILWPYLDLLKGTPQTHINFIKKGFKGFPILTLKKLGALIIGDFEQKSVAKLYFTHFKLRLFQYYVYKTNIHILCTWISKIDLKTINKQ